MNNDAKIVRLLTQKATHYVSLFCEPEELQPYFAGRYVAELFTNYKESGMSFDNFCFALGIDSPESIPTKWEELDQHYK